jgi:shikimate kinase
MCHEGGWTLHRLPDRRYQATHRDGRTPRRRTPPTRTQPSQPTTTRDTAAYRAPVTDPYQTCMVLLLGYPGVGKRTVGSHVAHLLDGVLVDNQLINIPLLTLFRWDGKTPIPMEIWERVGPIRAAVLGTIEDLAPRTNSYVFTNVIEDDKDGATQYEQLRSLALRRGSLFLSVMLDCDVEEQVRRIDNPDRVARMKGSDPEGYRWHRARTALYQPPPEDVLRLDTTTTAARRNAETIY